MRKIIAYFVLQFLNAAFYSSGASLAYQISPAQYSRLRAWPAGLLRKFSGFSMQRKMER
jgi:hypothetical protein